MSGARAAKASEALGLTSMMAWLGQVPRRAAGGRAMYRTVVFFFRFVGKLPLQRASTRQHIEAWKWIAIIPRV